MKDETRTAEERGADDAIKAFETLQNELKEIDAKKRDLDANRRHVLQDWRQYFVRMRQSHFKLAALFRGSESILDAVLVEDGESSASEGDVIRYITVVRDAMKKRGGR